jgi:hypothetical protein
MQLELNKCTAKTEIYMLNVLLDECADPGRCTAGASVDHQS